VTDRPVLDREEMEALRSAMSETSAPAPTVSVRQALPVALIADDRAGERARPFGLQLGRRWGEAVRARLAKSCGVALTIDRLGAEIVDPPSLRGELPLAWTQRVEVEGRPGAALVVATGAMVEALAARMLGAALDEAPAAARGPSATAVRLFGSVGRALVDALAEAWREEQSASVRATKADPILDGDALIVVSLALTGATTGTVRLVARPETLLPPPPPPRVVSAPTGAIDEVLGAVPVELLVEFGRARMTMSELLALQPGAVIALHQRADELVTVLCGGVVKAFGRPLVARGALAVEIVDPEAARPATGEQP
jgi:flagellar motor switch protein FliN/FliY